MGKHATGVPGVLSVEPDEKWDDDNIYSGGTYYMLTELLLAELFDSNAYSCM